MKTEIQRQFRKTVRRAVCLFLLTVAMIAPYVLSASEPVKICLFGGALLAIAIWARKYLKPQSHLR
jgi:hypothetical protein